MSNVNNVKCQQCQMSTMSNVNNFKCQMSTISNVKYVKYVKSAQICWDPTRSIKILFLWDLSDNVKMSKCQPNCQNINQIVKISIKLSNCHNIKCYQSVWIRLAHWLYSDFQYFLLEDDLIWLDHTALQTVAEWHNKSFLQKTKNQQSESLTAKVEETVECWWNIENI